MSEPAVVRIEAPRRSATLDLHELWEYRDLLWFIVKRDIKVRYTQTSLGIAWAVVQPVLTMLLFSVIFGQVAKLPSDGLPYPIFALAALLPWQLFSTALTSTANSVVGASHLISKVYFPRLIVPISAVATTLVDFGIVFVITLAMMAWYSIAPRVELLTLPLFVVLALAAALGVGLWASALNVRYRDVRYVIPFVVQFWLYASPVAYSASMITSPTLKAVYALNPMVLVIQGFRWALLGAEPPTVAMVPSAVMMMAMLLGGLYFFKRTEASFADVI